MNVWDQVKDDDEEEQAEDAVDEDIGSSVTQGILGSFYANPSPGMRHRTTKQTMAPEPGSLGFSLWKACWAVHRHSTQRSAQDQG